MKPFALLLFSAAALAAVAGPTRHSGFDDMSPATQAQQRDDLENPALLWLKDGEQRFASDCRRCHEPASLRGVAARYPAFDAAFGRPVSLRQRINLCRTRHLKAELWAAESQPLLALEVYVANASRGMPIAPPDDARLAPWRERGRRLFVHRFGQLDLSCAQCHDDHAGGRLGGSPIPQGHPTGYPIYRLQWQGVGSVERRFRNCMAGVRAEPFGYGAPEFVALELYLMQRAAGMAVETPAVRP
jgi:sulfur-oxidizing protein SoxA